VARSTVAGAKRSARRDFERRDSGVPKSAAERFRSAAAPFRLWRPLGFRCRTDALPACGRPQPTPQRKASRGAADFPRRETERRADCFASACINHSPRYVTCWPLVDPVTLSRASRAAGVD
jgi:hypothetical protein